MYQRSLVRVPITILVAVLIPHPLSTLSRAQDKPDEVIILAEGTTLTVKTLEEINSKTVDPGDTLKFLVTADVVINGQVVISKGTPAKGSVINALAGGSMGKAGTLGIAVESTATVDGGGAVGFVIALLSLCRTKLDALRALDPGEPTVHVAEGL